MLSVKATVLRAASARCYGHAYRLEATIGVEVLLTTAQLKGSESEGLISMCGTKSAHG